MYKAKCKMQNVRRRPPPQRQPSDAAYGGPPPLQAADADVDAEVWLAANAPRSNHADVRYMRYARACLIGSTRCRAKLKSLKPDTT